MYIEQQFFTTSVGKGKAPAAGGRVDTGASGSVQEAAAVAAKRGNTVGGRFMGSRLSITPGGPSGSVGAGVGAGAGDSGASALGSGGGENGVLNRIGFALLERISRAIVEGEVRPAAINNSLDGCAARDDFAHFFLSR